MSYVLCPMSYVLCPMSYASLITLSYAIFNYVIMSYPVYHRVPLSHVLAAYTAYSLPAAPVAPYLFASPSHPPLCPYAPMPLCSCPLISGASYTPFGLPFNPFLLLLSLSPCAPCAPLILSPMHMCICASVPLCHYNPAILHAPPSPAELSRYVFSQVGRSVPGCLCAVGSVPECTGRERPKHHGYAGP
jgi:hypothetical protein